MKIESKLLQFQAKSLSVKKDSSNPAFKGSKYASLSEIIQTINPVLTELKLVVVNTIREGAVVTEIRDTESEELISASFPLFGSKPQEFGSSITYARRYNIGALLNLHIDDDDDGNASNESKRTSYDQEEVKWYNDVKKNIDTWADMVADGKTTPSEIIAKIEAQGYKLSNANKDEINAL